MSNVFFSLVILRCGPQNSIPQKEHRTEANFINVTLMELLVTKVKIYLPKIVIKHVHLVLWKDDIGHSLPYAFWPLVFEKYSVPIQFWSLQTTKDVIGLYLLL